MPPPARQNRPGKTAKKNTQATASSTKRNQQPHQRTAMPLTSKSFADEDIDDDLAFDSDDDKEFGSFFEAQAARRKLEQEQQNLKNNKKNKKQDEKSDNKKKNNSKMLSEDDDGEGDDEDNEDFDDDDEDDDYSSIGSLLDDDSEDEALRKKYGSKKKDGDNDEDDVDFEDSDFDEEANDDFDVDDDDSNNKKKNNNNNNKSQEDAAAASAESASSETQNKKDSKTKIVQTPAKKKTQAKKAKPVADVTSAESLFPSSFVSQNSSKSKRSDADDLLGALTGTLLASSSSTSNKEGLDRLKKVTTSAAELLTLKKKKTSKKQQRRGNNDEDDDDYLVDTDVLMPEADSEEVLKADRKQTRQMVQQDMEKWKEFLRTQRKNKTLKFPLKAPDQDPTAATLGGFANAVQHRQLSDLKESTTSKQTASSKPTSALATAQSLAQQANELLGASGFGKTQAQREVAKQQQLASKQESGEYVGFKGGRGGNNNNDDSDDDDDDGGADGENTVLGGGGGGGAMTAQEFQETREHVAKLKSVLGYELARRRRLNRIKSKTYRRILRMEKEKTQQKRQAAEALLDPAKAQQRLQRKLDKQRAEERVLQRHKNTSKWILHAKRFAQFDEGAKDAVQDQHRQHAVLMQKMQETATAEQDEALGITNKNGRRNDDNSDDDDRVVDSLFAGKGKSVLWNNTNDDDGDDSKNTKINTKGMTPNQVAQVKLSEMDFMKRGRDKARRENETAAESLVNEVSKRVGADAAAADADSSSSKNKKNDSNNNARMKFTSNQNVDADLKATATTAAQRRRQREEDDDKNNNNNNNNDDAAASSSSIVVTNNNNNMIGASTTLKAKTKASLVSSNAKSSTATTTTSSTSNAPVMMSKEDKNDRQDYLISRAFAQDDLDEEFTTKKSSQVESVMKPQDPNASLPGWGEWGGNDAKLNQQHRERVGAADLKRRMEKSTLLSARADAALDNVIINHDVDLVASKYTLHMVPRPFASAQEFHRSMRQPVGPEWTTPQSFKRQIAPKIVARSGVVIDPVDTTTGLRKKSKTSMKKKDLDKKNVKKLSVNKSQK